MRGIFFALGILALFAQGTSAKASDTWTEEPQTGRNSYIYRVTDAGGQAVKYLDSSKIQGLWQRLIATNATVRDVIRRIYADNGCSPNGNYLDEEMSDSFCGDLQHIFEENTVLWQYERGGWAEGSVAYRSYLAFTSAGTGRFTHVPLAIDVVIDSVATEESLTGAGEPAYIVTYTFTRAAILDEEGNSTEDIDLQ